MEGIAESLAGWLQDLPPVEGLTAANMIALAVAALALLGVIATALAGRRNVQETNATTLTVHSKTAAIDAAQVQLSDRQFQARWEERLEAFTKMQGENYDILLQRVAADNERLSQRVEALSQEVAEIPALRQALADCEARDARRDVEVAQMKAELRRLGGTSPC